MGSIDLFISNARHHLEMTLPVAERLREIGHRSRIVSICELRGESTPALEASAVEIVQVMPERGAQREAVTARTAPDGFARRAARAALWRAVIRPRLRNVLAQSPADAVVVPNDLAFPFPGILELVHRASTPSVLLQEGILFELPASGSRAYGGGGCTAVAAWGAPYADYFKAVGVADNRAVATGSPRYDNIQRSRFQEDAVQLRATLQPNDELIITFLTTHVDKLGGHCTTKEKMEAFVVFLDEVAPLLKARRARLVVKPHKGEDFQEYRRACDGRGDAVLLIQDAPVYPLLIASDAVLSNGSTAGLEAVLLDVPLGVVAVPNSGFIHDFVDAKVGIAVPIGADTASAVEQVLGGALDLDRQDREVYLDHHLANRGHAVSAVAELVASLV